MGQLAGSGGPGGTPVRHLTIPGVLKVEEPVVSEVMSKATDSGQTTY